jgi:hypothetical protein
MTRAPLLFCIAILAAPAVNAFDHQHGAYERILKETVLFSGHQSKVDYRLLKDRQAELQAYLGDIEGVRRETYEEWDRSQQMAFLINAYNAFTLKLIVDNYPGIESIRDLGGLVFNSPWKQKFFTLFDRSAHLDYIEHDLLRRDFNDPRIHFAIVCASRGCPPLLTTAYVGERLDEQLDNAARNFLTDPERNRYNATRRRLELSPIFNWFQDDFVKQAGSIQAFVAPYISSDPEIRLLLQNRGASITYLDYDWSLNGI